MVSLTVAEVFDEFFAELQDVMHEDESVSGKRRRLLDLKGRLDRARKIMVNPSYET